MRQVMFHCDCCDYYDRAPTCETKQHFATPPSWTLFYVGSKAYDVCPRCTKMHARQILEGITTKKGA